MGQKLRMLVAAMLAVTTIAVVGGCAAPGSSTAAEQAPRVTSRCEQAAASESKPVVRIDQMETDECRYTQAVIASSRDGQVWLDPSRPAELVPNGRSNTRVVRGDGGFELWPSKGALSDARQHPYDVGPGWIPVLVVHEDSVL